MTDLTPETRTKWREDAEWAATGNSPWANIQQADRTLALLDALDEAERERDEAREEAAELRETFDARVESAAGRWKRRAKRAEGLHEAMAVENRRLNGALARVEALIVPQWHTNRGHEHDYLADAYAAGRNDFIDRIRLALAGPNSTDTEGDDRD